MLLNSPEEWSQIAYQFQEKWQFPNCIGAGDSTHIWIPCPTITGPEYFNYKGFYSLALLPFVGANYKFLYINVGCKGS